LDSPPKIIPLKEGAGCELIAKFFSLITSTRGD